MDDVQQYLKFDQEADVEIHENLSKLFIRRWSAGELYIVGDVDEKKN